MVGGRPALGRHRRAEGRGAVLPICLAEIDRSRPYFLGLLGQRYGWVPEELPEHLTDQLPWLGTPPGTSVTELEFLHGVLNDADAAGHVFFHLRDPAWVDSRPPEERLVLGEHPSADDGSPRRGGAEAAAGRRRAWPSSSSGCRAPGTRARSTPTRRTSGGRCSS